jgi:4-aminobutyrate aminotransferase-like enzyme/Ser/Thr protein kinase RdoA (MazF antagonist)
VDVTGTAGAAAVRKPILETEAAAGLLRSAYGLEGAVEPLAGERDATMAVRTLAGERYVLKVASADEPEGALALEVAALEHLHARGARLRLPRVLPDAEGARIGRWTGLDGAVHAVRLYSWVPGEVWARVRPHDPALRASLGAAVARLTNALAGFKHPAASRDFVWDLTLADRAIELSRAITDPIRRAQVESILERVAALRSQLGDLPRAVLYNDANDWNVLVAGGEAWDREVVGFVDFGDLLAGPVVADLAIAIAYGVMGTKDPLNAAVEIVAGYARERPLFEAELAVLVPLVRTRLALSVTLSARRSTDRTAHEYLSISQAPAWALLDRFAALPDRLAEYAFRGACGYEPCPASTRLRRWLAHHGTAAKPVLDVDLRAAPVALIDLSVGSPDSGTLADLDDLEVASRRVERHIADRRARVGIGRWDEVRATYRAAPFRAEGNDRDEYRTVHLGVDLFAPAGTPVHAPLAGTVLDVRDNAGRFDYGPTVLLEHRAQDEHGDFAFCTLYGHLSRDGLSLLQPGAAVAAGAPVGHIGGSDVNGGWPPHVHVQLIADRLGHDTGFPGVARVRERALWLSLSPDPSVLLRIPPDRLPERSADAAQLAAERRDRLGPNLSLSYRQPLHIVRGFRQYLYDAHGQPYLDAVNNVPHVGHCHPRITAAAAAHKAVLETNTRYLHENIVRLAARLAGTLPPSLEVCFFVNSGSEANELALRLARAYTKKRGVVVLDAGYHGNTTTLIDVSPYKHDGPGGEGPPPWVRKIPLPDPYRGRYRGAADAGRKHAAHVEEAARALRESGFAPGAFLAESIASCGGQIVPPDGFLAAAWAAARAQGAVCIADEVQTGLGRVGEAFWAFQLQAAVPDIVTIGKPFGNGHPLGAVVTTREIAYAFANGMEYFNTFGGNPVSCAIGLAVLDVIDDEGLQENARAVGGQLLRGLQALMARHPLIGDVRGRGLFLGFELVMDRESRSPAAEAALRLVNRARDKGVLLSTDGPDRNVIKIKPPLCFGRDDADRLLAVLDDVLSEDFFRVRGTAV